MSRNNGESKNIDIVASQRSLTGIFAIYTITSLLVTGLFFYISLVSSLNRFFVFSVFLLVLFVIFILCYRYFTDNIYDPIITVVTAARILMSGESERFLNHSSYPDQYPNAAEIRDMLERLRNSVNRQYSAEILKRQAEFSALQSQINPHFLYNTLEAIRGQALVEGMDEIAEMTEALSTLFRYSISQKGDLVSLEDELSNVESYFVIQQYRFNNKFNFSIKFDDTDNDIFECILPKLTLQPIVENAIYHGLEPKVGSGNITIRIAATEKRLIIKITDDGLGIDKESLDKLNYKINKGLNQTENQDQMSGLMHTGIALVNVNVRIRLIFGEQYGVTVSSTKGFGTEVEIVLPIVKDIDGKMDHRRKGYIYEN